MLEPEMLKFFVISTFLSCFSKCANTTVQTNDEGKTTALGVT